MSEVRRKPWRQKGNVDTDPLEDFVGNEDAQDLRIATNSDTKMRYIDATAAMQRTDDGDPRGTDAVDLQRNRALDTQVASGTRSSVLSGINNTASGVNASVVSGATNVNAGNNSVIGSGVNNEITAGSFNAIITGNTNVITAGNGHFIGGGQANNITGGILNAVIHGFNCDVTDGLVNHILGGSTNIITNGIASQILGGAFNSIEADGAVICGGTGNAINSGTGTNLNGNIIGCGQNNAIPTGVLISSILNGFGCEIGTNATASTVINGNGSKTDRYMETIHGASTNFGTKGSAQCGNVPMYAQTTDDTATVLDTFGVTSFIMPADRLVDFSCKVTAYEESGGSNDSASFWRRGLIENRGGTTALVGAIQTINTDIGSNAGIPPIGWTVTITANNANDTLDITVQNTGVAANINWIAHVEFNQVGE